MSSQEAIAAIGVAYNGAWGRGGLHGGGEKGWILENVQNTLQTSDTLSCSMLMKNQTGGAGGGGGYPLLFLKRSVPAQGHTVDASQTQPRMWVSQVSSLEHSPWSREPSPTLQSGEAMG